MRERQRLSWSQTRFAFGRLQNLDQNINSRENAFDVPAPVPLLRLCALTIAIISAQPLQQGKKPFSTNMIALLAASSFDIKFIDNLLNKINNIIWYELRNSLPSTNSCPVARTIKKYFI